ncbi:2011_t:CDS:2 [Funneliformis geosporum]|nr:2011_t:CDS:2 [Funneliformis geosporum]
MRVNRLWCRLVTPILWSTPFKRYSQSYTPKIINTYISCLDVKNKKFLKSLGLMIPLHPANPLFYYPKYLEGFNIVNYTFAMKKWVKDHFHCVNKEWNISRTQRTLDSMVMDLIFNHSSSLKKFKYVNYSGFSRADFLEKLPYSDLSLISTLEFLGHGYSNEMYFTTLPKLFKQMSKSTRNIIHLSFYFPETSEDSKLYQRPTTFMHHDQSVKNSTELDLSVAELIRSQKSLKSFCTNEFWMKSSTDLIFTSLLSHSNSLEFIKFFTLIHFDQSFFHYMKQINSLRTLEFKRFLFKSSSFNLSHLIIPQNYLPQVQNVYCDEGDISNISKQLINIILRLSDHSLKKFYFKEANSVILSTIELYCPNITHLHISLKEESIVPSLNVIKKLPLISFYLHTIRYSRTMESFLPSTLQYFGLSGNIGQDSIEKLLANAYLPNLSTMEILKIHQPNDRIRKIFIKFSERFNHRLKELKLEKSLLKLFISSDKRELWNTRSFKISEVKFFKYAVYAKGKSTIITLTSETVNGEAINVEGTSAGNAEENQIIEGLDSLLLDTPPETLNSLPNVFIDRMGNNFRWPTSMPQCTREQVFWTFTDNEVLEDDQEYGLNSIYFYDCLDKGLFNDHKEDWVLVYKQRIVEYGEKKTRQQLGDLDREMPMSHDGDEYMIQVRVKRVDADDTRSFMFPYQFIDTKNANKHYKTVLDTGAPETILPYEVRANLGNSGWERTSVHTPRYEAPAKLFVATVPFLISIGDNRSWSRWVKTNTLRVWERDPGNQVNSSLVGNDILDQLMFTRGEEASCS